MFISVYNLAAASYLCMTLRLLAASPPFATPPHCPPAFQNFSILEDPVMLPCNHPLCRGCATQCLRQNQRCPQCLAAIPNLRMLQGRNTWIAEMVCSLKNCLNEVGVSLTQHAPGLCFSCWCVFRRFLPAVDRRCYLSSPQLYTQIRVPIDAICYFVYTSIFQPLVFPRSAVDNRRWYICA